MMETVAFPARRGVTILLEVISSFLATASKTLAGDIARGDKRTRALVTQEAQARSKESLVFAAEAVTYGNCFDTVCCKERGMGPNRKEEEGFIARTRRFLHSFKPSGNRVTIWNKGASK